MKKTNRDKHIKEKIVKPTTITMDVWDKSDEEIEWDNTPEQIQLTGQRINISDSDDLENMEQLLVPCRLFDETSDTEYKTCTTTKPKTKLQRRNAIRRKNKTCARTEPRKQEKGKNWNTRSYPTSPSEVDTNRVQNLNAILRAHEPLVPHAVRLDSTVQQVGHALENMEARNNLRRSARIRARAEDGCTPINYLGLHKEGRLV